MTGTSLDPRTPVLVGYGQVNQHTDPSDAVEPVALMAQAARAAADPRVLAAVDAIRVVNLLSWRYRDPGLALGGLIGADAPATRYTGIGGNVPQTLVNQACLDIMAGRNEVVLLAGAETWRTRKAQKANGIRPDWTSQDESVPVPPGAEDAVEGVALAGEEGGEIRVEPRIAVGLADHGLDLADGQVGLLGQAFQEQDKLIAAHALALGCTLVTNNLREFERVPGLSLENWAQDRS